MDSVVFCTDFHIFKSSKLRLLLLLPIPLIFFLVLPNCILKGLPPTNAWTEY